MSDFHKQATLPDLQKHGKIVTPKQIGPYKIESLLAKGGMSTLYLGIHPETNQPIVIKVLLAKYCKNKELAKRFLKEAEIIRTSEHPNIVEHFGQGVWENGLYIAMEFVRGISLRQFIEQKSLTTKKALEIIIQVAYALCHLHTHGIVHRDLKPENILITETSQIKVIDFGIAQMKTEIESDRITQRKRLMGTPTYMSPEQKEHPSHLSFNSDIYSLAIITYELILGKLSHGIINLSLLPPALRPILSKALESNPKKRTQDIVDFITEISQCIQSIHDHEPQTQDASKFLLPAKMPRSPHFEIHMAANHAREENGLYVDFFNLKRNRFAIILATPVVKHFDPLLVSSIFRGMVHMAITQDLPLDQTLAHINETLFNDALKPLFKFSLLLLDPTQDLLTFTSCENGDLYLSPPAGNHIRKLQTPNPLLGQIKAPNFSIINQNYSPEDTLIVHTDGISPPEDLLWIEKYHLLTKQMRVDRFFEELKKQKRIKKDQLSLLFTITRIF